MNRSKKRSAAQWRKWWAAGSVEGIDAAHRRAARKEALALRAEGSKQQADFRRRVRVCKAQVMTVAEAAERMQVSVRGMRLLCISGAVDAVKVAGKWQVTL